MANTLTVLPSEIIYKDIFDPEVKAEFVLENNLEKEYIVYKIKIAEPENCTIKKYSAGILAPGQKKTIPLVFKSRFVDKRYAAFQNLFKAFQVLYKVLDKVPTVKRIVNCLMPDFDSSSVSVNEMAIYCCFKYSVAENIWRLLPYSLFKAAADDDKETDKAEAFAEIVRPEYEMSMVTGSLVLMVFLVVFSAVGFSIGHLFGDQIIEFFEKIVYILYGKKGN